MRNKYPKAAILALFFALLAASAIQVQAQIGYTQRDYMAERYRSHYGVVPIVGTTYGLSPNDSRYKKLVTFSMRKHSAVLVEIVPLRQPAGIMLLVSRPDTPGTLKPVWRETNLSKTIRFWTDRYWFPLERCDSMGCPIMTFKATDGAVQVHIVDVKKDTRKDEYPGFD